MPKKGGMHVSGYTRKKHTHIDQNEIMKIKWRFANKFMCIDNESGWARWEERFVALLAPFRLINTIIKICYFSEPIAFDHNFHVLVFCRSSSNNR